MDTQNETAIVIIPKTGELRNKSTETSAIIRGQQGTAAYVPHLSPGQVRGLAIIARQNKRHGERNALLIKALFDGALRVSEALSIRPCDLDHQGDIWTVKILGKGGKFSPVAISASLVAELQSFCYRQGIAKDSRIFPITRSQAFRVITCAFDKAGIPRPRREREHVGAVHILRHSGAIERLRLTGNPKAVQDHLRHSTAEMTLRYLKTLSAEESLRIQGEVDFKW